VLQMCYDAIFHVCQMIAMMIFKIYHNANIIGILNLHVMIKATILPIPGYCNDFK